MTSLAEILVKPWPDNITPFVAHRFPVFTTSYTTPQEMLQANDAFEAFLQRNGFTESQATDASIVISEAMDNARKANLNAGVSTVISMTVVANPGYSFIVFIEDQAGMMGAARMKFDPPHETLAEHGRGGFIMRTLSTFMAIIPSPYETRKDVILGFIV